MRLVNLRANEVKTVNTKFGEKLLIVASGDLKSEIKIWRPLTDPASIAIKPNQFFTAAVDSQGKYSPIANPEPTQEIYTPNQYSPLATIPKTIQAIEVREVESETTKTIHPHIAKMAQCVSAIRNELPGLDPESEQKYATSLFIAAAKEIF